MKSDGISVQEHPDLRAPPDNCDEERDAGIWTLVAAKPNEQNKNMMLVSRFISYGTLCCIVPPVVASPLIHQF